MNVKLIGNFIQHLEVELLPGEEFYAQKGALIYLEQGIEKEILMNGGGTGTLGALGNLIGAKLSGESIFLTHYYNRTQSSKKIVFGGSFGLHPIKIQNETLICNKGVYVASNNSVQISTQISIAGILGGMGVFLQKISGNSTIFLDCKGQPITKELGYGETIEVDENHIIALQGISEAQLSSAWSLKNILGGEGLSMLKIIGPGRVHLSPGSLPSEYRPTNQ
ncbi:AIM24 family protein [Hallella bergensis]|uniref:AIM24 family protein n=1 Tax=Hallella bergensis TaxID=242750 RepID=UPI0023F38225|nr:AIM24 family protein [Hallella bergensis]